MRLLYWYTRFLDMDGQSREYRGIREFELNLGVRSAFHFDAVCRTLTETPYQAPLPELFWGKKPLYNLNVIVGNNGAGKSTVVNYVIDTLQMIYKRQIDGFDENILIFEYGQTVELLHINPCGDVLYHGEVHYSYHRLPDEDHSEADSLLKRIDRIKLIYMTNALSEIDSNRAKAREKEPHIRASYLYDCSLSGTIRHNYVDDNGISNTDLLDAFFTNEHYKEVKFVCDKTQNKYMKQLEKEYEKDRIKVPVPKALTVTFHETGLAYRYGFDFKNVPKEVIGEYDLDFGDWIICMMCAACYETFLKNIRESANEELLPNTMPTDLESFQRLFTTAHEVKVDSTQTLVSEQEGVTLLYRNCVQFIQFIFNSKDTLASILLKFQITSSRQEHLVLTIPINDESMAWLLDFMELYRDTCHPHYYLDFSWGLSSGENNLLRMFSALFYAFDHSESNLYNWYRGEQRTSCDSVLLLMDEADLTYHPEWQRQFVQILSAFLSMEFGLCGIQDLQVVLTTHSPLLLGDIPPNNVTYLGGRGKTANTFGQNIHMILKDSFFLSSGTIGAFAGKKINDSAKALRQLADKNPNELTEEDCQKLKDQESLIALVAPGVLKNKLIELYEQAERHLYPEGRSGGRALPEALRIKWQAQSMSENQLKELIQIYETELGRRKHD